MVTAEFSRRFRADGTNSDGELSQYMDTKVVRTDDGEWKLSDGWSEVFDIGN